MASRQYFDFLGSVWEMLPEEDKGRIGELWHGYEQVFASVYQKFLEHSLNIVTQTLRPFSAERWLPYSFSSSNFIEKSAVYSSSQDLSVGVNLSSKYLLRFRVDGSHEFEVNIQGPTPESTSIDYIIERINLKAGYKFARSIFENTIIQLVSPTTGVNSRIEVLPPSNPSADACEFVLGLEPSELPLAFPKFPYIYTLPYSNIAQIPELRTLIRDDGEPTLFKENLDFVVEDYKTISFAELPPEKLWASRTMINDETPWNNYGFLMDIYAPNKPTYANLVQGLWYAFWTGPRPSNVKTSLYLLFGLPTAPYDGVATAVSSESITITDSLGKETVFEVPVNLTPTVEQGEEVKLFQPLVDGIEVFDKVNYPGFVREEIGRTGLDRFLTENASRGFGEDTDETKALRLLDEYTFLPQISVDAFITPDINLSNVRTFLDTIRPTNKAYMFQVIVGAFEDPIPFEEKTEFHIDVDVTPSVDYNQTTYMEEAPREEYEENDNDALNLDSDGVLFQEKVEIEVYSFGSLVESFTA